jgi:hypothetical protein
MLLTPHTSWKVADDELAAATYCWSKTAQMIACCSTNIYA